jgi:hypothetical protein
VGLEEVGARLITEGEAQFLGAMMKAQNAVKGVGTASDTAQGPMQGLTTRSLALATALGHALYDGAIAAGRAMIAFASESITAASDLNETVSKVGVVFGDQGDAMVRWGKTAAFTLGMSENAALTAAGTYGNLFRAMGMGTMESAHLSASLVTVAGDLASFNNMDPTEVMDKLRAGLSGESEPLKSLGININEAIIRQEAMTMGLVKGKDALTASAKAQAVYSLIMKQTTLAQGDFARTSSGLANQQRIMAANVENLKAQLGTAFLPIVNMAIQGLNSLFANPAVQKGLQNLIDGIIGISNAFQEGFGFAEGGDLFGNIIDGLVNVLYSVGLDGVSDWVQGVYMFINDLPEMFNTVMASILAIIQPALNILSAWWEDNSVSVMGSLESMWASIQSIFNTIVQLIVNIIAIIAPLVQMFLTSLAQWWAENGTQIIATVSVLWASVSHLFQAAAGLISAIVGALVRVIMAFWTAHGTEVMTFLTGLWTFIAGLFTTVTGTIALIFEAFTALLNGDTEEFSAKMQEAWQFLWDAIRGAAEVAWAALSTWFKGIIKAILKFFSDINWGDIGSNIINGIWRGLQAGWTWLHDKIRDLANSLFKAAEDALDMGSPSKVFENIGVNMMLGWGKGINEGAMIPAVATAQAAQMAIAPAAAVSAGPSTYNYSTANNYNLSVMTSQSSQVVTRSFAMMKMLAA